MKRLIVILVLLSAAAIGVRADLKTWLHGAPPAPSPGPPDAKAATVSFAPNLTPDKQILDFMNAFAEAMRVHDGKTLTRDYFRVEDQMGLRFWLYREGLYGREIVQPNWFLHGLFA